MEKTNFSGVLTPTANLTVNKNRKKIYSTKTGKVIYLKNNSEFEIECFNPTKNTYGILIYINDNLISSNYLVLKPGQHIFLDRYIDDNKKFKFNTYMVDNNDVVKEAIKHNGNIRIEFYQEKVNNYTITYWDSYTYTSPYTSPKPNPTPNPTPPYPGIYYTSTIGNLTSGNVKVSDMSAVYNTSNNTLKDVTIQKDYLETGRIEKGNMSEQKFDTVNIDFNSYSSYSYEYKILPESQKNIQFEEIKRYCSNCGKRIRNKKANYCDACGTKL